MSGASSSHACGTSPTTTVGWVRDADKDYGLQDTAHVIQRIARHADPDVTLGIYAHPDLDAMRGALDSIEWDDL